MSMKKVLTIGTTVETMQVDINQTASKAQDK